MGAVLAVVFLIEIDRVLKVFKMRSRLLQFYQIVAVKSLSWREMEIVRNEGQVDAENGRVIPLSSSQISPPRLGYFCEEMSTTRHELPPENTILAEPSMVTNFPHNSASLDGTRAACAPLEIVPPLAHRPIPRSNYTYDLIAASLRFVPGLATLPKAGSLHS
jgi:hypothetical protein